LKNWIYHLIGIFFIFLFFHDYAVAREVSQTYSPNEIKWHRAYFPPVTIPSGPDADSGFFDRVTMEENTPAA